MAMRKPSPLFQSIIFALLAVWFLLLAATFFISRPIALIALLPEFLLIALITPAAYAIGGFVIEQLRLEEVLLPGEEFVLGTTIGLGGLSLLTVVVGLLGLLTWWTVGLGLIAAIAVGFYRIVGLVTPPAYLFGPEDLGEEAPDPVSWVQYIFIAIWAIALANFCLLPPIHEQSLATTLGAPSQWVQSSAIHPGGMIEPSLVALPEGLFAMALVLRGGHLAVMVGGLMGGLAISLLYLCTKRYCGPVAARSTLLIAASLPLFSHGFLAPGEALAGALFQVSAFYCLLRWFDEEKRRWSVLAGLFIGLSLSTTAIAVFFLPPLLVSAFVWAAIRKRWRGFLLNLGIMTFVAVVALSPWLAVDFYLFGTPAAWAQPLWEIKPPSLLLGQIKTWTLPLSISFPAPSLPPWEIIGPIFLVFIPFYFITYRKNPATGLAAAVGLAFLAFAEPFGLGLEMRLAALMLLSIPTAMAAHRFVETGIRKTLVLAALYLMIGWQIFHATAMVETVYPSPHRFLLGLESSEQLLERSVDYYPFARHIDQWLPSDAHLLALGHRGVLYINRRVTVATPELSSEIIRALLEASDTEATIEGLRNQGYTHLLIDAHSARSGPAALIGDFASPAELEKIDQLLAKKQRRVIRIHDIILYSLLR
jgi:hypothetical protein